MNKPVLAAVATCVLLVGCTTAGPGPGMREMSETALLVGADVCNTTRVKCINLTVNSATNQINDPGNAYFQDANHLILWTAPANYTFASDGITITGGSPAADEFTCKGGPQGKLYLCINRHASGSSGSPKTYKYKIRFNEAAAPLDPQIINN